PRPPLPPLTRLAPPASPPLSLHDALPISDSSLLIANQPRSPHSSDRPRRLAGEGLSEPTAGSGLRGRRVTCARRGPPPPPPLTSDPKSTRLHSSPQLISSAVFSLKNKKSH